MSSPREAAHPPHGHCSFLGQPQQTLSPSRHQQSRASSTVSRALGQGWFNTPLSPRNAAPPQLQQQMHPEVGSGEPAAASLHHPGASQQQRSGAKYADAVRLVRCLQERCGGVRDELRHQQAARQPPSAAGAPWSGVGLPSWPWGDGKAAAAAMPAGYTDATAHNAMAEDALLDVIDAVMAATSAAVAPATSGPHHQNQHAAEAAAVEERESALTLLVEAGLIPALAAVIDPPGSAPPPTTTTTTGAAAITELQRRCLALEALCCLLSPQLAPHDAGLARDMAPRLVAVLQRYVVQLELEALHHSGVATKHEAAPLVGEAVSQQVHDQAPPEPTAAVHAFTIPQDRASAPAWLQSRMAVTPSLIQQQKQLPPHDGHRLDGGATSPGVGGAPPSAQWHEAGLSAASCLVRMAKFPAASRALVEAKAVPLLARLLRLGPEDVRQVVLLGLYKLANPPPPPQLMASPPNLDPSGGGSLQFAEEDPQGEEQHGIVLRQLLLSGAIPELCNALLDMPPPHQPPSHAPGEATSCGQSSSAGGTGVSTGIHLRSDDVVNSTQPLLTRSDDIPAVSPTQPLLTRSDDIPAVSSTQPLLPRSDDIPAVNSTQPLLTRSDDIPAVSPTQPLLTRSDDVPVVSPTQPLLPRCMPDLIGALLVDMVGLPGLPQLFAERGIVRHVVPLLSHGDPQVCA